jgi:serralysin
MRGIDGFPRLARSYIFKIRRFPKIPKQTLFDAGTVSGTSAALESLETSFREDLNGDGTIGPVTTVIESFGSTSLVQVGSNYFLDSISTSTGPELKYNGAPIAAAQFGASVVLIGAEATPTGYDVAWTVNGTNEYSVWSTDSNGSFVANLTGTVSGNSTVLENLENTFHQDLNGDGTIGIPVTQTVNAVHRV